METRHLKIFNLTLTLFGGQLEQADTFITIGEDLQSFVGMVTQPAVKILNTKNIYILRIRKLCFYFSFLLIVTIGNISNSAIVSFQPLGQPLVALTNSSLTGCHAR